MSVRRIKHETGSSGSIIWLVTDVELLRHGICKAQSASMSTQFDNVSLIGSTLDRIFPKIGPLNMNSFYNTGGKGSMRQEREARGATRLESELL
jgi:hypothetical protein